MTILLLTPGISKNFNDNYFAYKYIANLGHRVVAISNRQIVLKDGGLSMLPVFEQDSNLFIHRIFNSLPEQKWTPLTKTWNAISSIMHRYKPDLILSENGININAAIYLKRRYFIPLIVRFEIIRNEHDPYCLLGFKKFIRNSLTGDLVGVIIGRLYERYVFKYSDAVISCYKGDIATLNVLRNYGMRAYYVPWPTEITIDTGNISKRRDRAIFAGSLDRHKNIIEFANTIPAIISKTPIKKFYIIGQGIDLPVINKLINRYPNNIVHVSAMSRNQCLRLIASCYLSYSPVLWGGWGFIGDSWGVKTPLLVTHNHYFFENGKDALIATKNNIVEKINFLYNKRDLYKKLVYGGFDRFSKYHRAEKIGEYYATIFISVKDHFVSLHKH